MNSQIKHSSLMKLLLTFFLFCFILLLTYEVSAQEHPEDPPRPLQVTTYQNLSFGAIIQGATGGIVTIDPQGSRNISGSIFPFYSTYLYYPAIFEIQAIPGSLITIVNGPDVYLNGSNGGKLLLHVGTSIPTSPFINTKNPPFRIQVRVGGTLTVGNSIDNPSGNYIGYFSVTFAQQ